MALVAFIVGLSLAGWGVLFYAAGVRMRQDANARAATAEQAARDAEDRTDKAIELWNDERADHTRDLEAFKAQLDVLREQALTTVAQYRHAFDQLAALVRAARDADDDDDDDATGATPRRVM